MEFFAKYVVFSLVTYCTCAIREKCKIGEPAVLSIYFAVTAVIFLL